MFEKKLKKFSFFLIFHLVLKLGHIFKSPHQLEWKTKIVSDIFLITRFQLESNETKTQIKKKK
jgi:hypothetical protein